MTLEVSRGQDIPSTPERSWTFLQRRNLDAAVRFLGVRNRYVASLDARGRPVLPGVEVVGIGLAAIRRSLGRRTCAELFSIGLENTAEKLDASYRADYAMIGSRIPMLSLYDYDTTDAGGRVELARRQSWGNSFYCSSRVQLKIYDRRCVVMEIPPVRDERTVIAVTDPLVVAEAFRYFRIVRSTAVPVRRVHLPESRPEFTERQHGVIRLLARGSSDHQIAAALQVSLRTVHYEVAAIIGRLGVTSRFEAGIRLAQLGMVA